MMNIVNKNKKIYGLIERITYHNPENGFCVIKVKIAQKKDLVAVVGYIPVVLVGEQLEATGEWIQDKQHGLQFKADEIKTHAPSSLEGIEKYLASGLIKGIGPIYAQKLITKFGLDVFSVIEEYPLKLKSVAGIGDLRANKIIDSWSAQKTIRTITIFLYSHNISTATSSKIYKAYGNTAIEVINKNPYRLAEDIRGIGFKSADKIAESIGIAKDSIVRARAGLKHVLATAMDDGHCGLPIRELFTKCSSLLELPEEVVRTALDLELNERTVLREYLGMEEGIYLSGLAASEDFIASKIYDMSKGNPSWDLHLVKLEFTKLTSSENNKLTLSSSQATAIEQAIKSKITIITGGPGVGKTTIVKTIVEILKAVGVEILLAAPTGRAAKRLSESTGMAAKTIHRLLGKNPERDKSANSPKPSQNSHSNTKSSTASNIKLKCDLLILDESSMIDVMLMHSVMKALPYKAALILVGDIDQLPSVGPGQILADLINSQKLPVIHLTEIFRQAKNSKIITNAHLINNRKMPDLNNNDSSSNTNTNININNNGTNTNADNNSYNASKSNDGSDNGYQKSNMSDFFFIEVKTPEEAISTINKLISQRIPKKFGFSSVKDIQVLTPMAKGMLGSRNLNIELQKLLNHSYGMDNEIHVYGNVFRTKDKVMQIENNYDKDIYNGDIGFITSIDSDEQEVTINYDGREVKYDYSEMDEIVLAYATTIHKSQGSEYQAIIIPLMMQHYNMLQKNLIYTAITRGKKLVVIVGEKKAMAVAINNKNQKTRYTNLKTKLNRIVNIDQLMLY